MKLKKLKINSFGNLKDKQIDFSDNINIIYAKNEGGKSTLLKFIINIFYGCSKNKKGKELSDYDRYKPWGTEEFSGKLEYELDNNEKYEVFRDFNKKNPKLYNEQKEDITKQYNIDKNTGSQFFLEQTQIEEELFLSSLAILQEEVCLEQNTQNIVVQKITNLTTTGEDSVSYNKTLEKINKKYVEEIGTERTQNKPINIVKQKIKELNKQKEELLIYQEAPYEITNTLKIKELELKENIKKLEYVQKIKKIKEQEKIHKEKIKVKKEINENLDKKIKELINKKQEIENKIAEIKPQKIKKENNKLNCLLIIFLIILNIVAYSIIKNIIFNSISISLLLIFILFYVLKKIRKNKKIKLNKIQIEQAVRQEKEKINALEKEINLIQENKKQNKVEEEQELLIKEQQLNKINLQKEYNNEILVKQDIWETGNIEEEYEKIQNKINENKIEINKIELERENITFKLENLAKIEEQLEEYKEEEKQLEKEGESILLAKEVLEQAYKEMKQQITPKFTQNLSNAIINIADGKYKNIQINEENGLIVEGEKGDYIPVNRLSIGTIDQLYLSLRLAVIKEITKENMPLFLDETFAYYDTERLKNVLQYLIKEFSENQIIIFTCTDREEIILKELNYSYHKIEL